MGALYELLNRMNDHCWAGAFTWWGEENLLVFRYGLVLAGEQVASPEQVDTMIHAAVMSCERFYPAVQLVPARRQEPGGGHAGRHRGGLRAGLTLAPDISAEIPGRPLSAGRRP